MSLPIDKALRKAQNHIKAGELTEAEELYKQVLSKFPKNKKATKGYQKLKAGITSKSPSTCKPPQEQSEELLSLYNRGRFEEVLLKIKPLISLFPKAIDLHNLQGASNAALERHEAAIKNYEQAIKINPNYADAHLNKGSALQEKGDLKSAIESFHQTLLINPNHTVANFNMGNVLHKKGELDAAVDSYKKALKINPDYAEAHFNMGNILMEQGKFTQAVEAYEQTLKNKTNHAHAYNNMGLALYESHKLETAIGSYKQAIKIQPDYAEAYNNIGIALNNKGDLDAAIDSYKQAIKIKPDYAEAYNNMGISLNVKGDLDAAIESYNQATKIKPDYAEAHHNLSFAFLNTGRLKEGLNEYEWRWRTAKRISKERHFSKPIWDGIQPLKDKTILLWGEQGPQDMTIWSSCLSHLSFRAGHCIIECPEKLVPLFGRSFPNVEVKVENRSLDTKRDDFDFHLPMGSLFRHFIPEISKEIKPDAFLIPDPARVNFWKERLNSLGKGPYVGISWKSPFITPARLPNYTQISDWAPVFSLSDVTFINLQSSDFESDLVAIQDEFGTTVHNFDDLDHYDDLLDVAALSVALDIVVSVSTAVSAIAAGVGTPTKLAAWRQSSWNNILLAPRGPSVEAFERNTWEPWDEVFQTIAKNIAKY